MLTRGRDPRRPGPAGVTIPRMPPARRRSAFFLAALGLAALGAAGCGDPGRSPGGASAKAGRDVLLVTIDTLREDATGFSGSGKAGTPSLDRLAKSGRVFPFAHAHAVTTLPSHASILTGLYPYQHGIRDNAGFVLRRDVPTMATVLRASGYATAAFVSAFTLDTRFGLGSGFDVYDDRTAGYSGRISTIAERPGETTVSEALAWWDAQAGRPRFLWVHLFAPHFPYEPGEPFASRHAKAPYYGEAELADAQIAPLLERVRAGSADGPVVVFTSDHGEALGDHGEQTHGVFAYEATLRVPLVISAPGFVPAGEDPRPARHVDVLPTVLDLLRIAPPGGLPGRSLVPAWDGTDDGSYFEALTSWLNRGWAPLYGRLEGKRKAIDLPAPELYDLGTDPRESRNLAPGEAQAMRAILSRVPAEARGSARREVPDPEVVERLGSLGYVAGPTPRPPSPLDEASDPKRQIGLLTRVDEAVLLYREKRDAGGAIRVLREILRQNPRMEYVSKHLAVILAEQGRTQEAVAVLSRAVALGVGGEDLEGKLALGLLQTGKAEEAWKLLERRTESEDPETQRALGVILATLGRPREAEDRFLKALAIDPTFPAARVDLGVLLLQQGRDAEAKDALRAALSENAYLPDGWNALGALLAKEGDLRGAVEAWERAVRLNPRLVPAYLNLAVAAAKLGDRERAAAALERLIPLVRGESRRNAEAMLARLRAQDPGR